MPQEHFAVQQGNPCTIGLDDPLEADVRALLSRHLAFADQHSPPEDVHALDPTGLLDPAISFYSCRQDGQVQGIGALKMLEPLHAELKSMHVATEARGRGIGRAMLDHLLGVAFERGVSRVSLETGSMDAFSPARTMYANAGFVVCAPFGDYTESSYSTFMTLDLGR